MKQREDGEEEGEKGEGKLCHISCFPNRAFFSVPRRRKSAAGINYARKNSPKVEQKNLTICFGEKTCRSKIVRFKGGNNKILPKLAQVFSCVKAREIRCVFLLFPPPPGREKGNGRRRMKRDIS